MLQPLKTVRLYFKTTKRGFKMSMLEYASIAVLLLGCAGVIMIFKPWDLD
jgi:hypothetical protein